MFTDETGISMTEPLHITLNFPFYHTVAFFALVFGLCFLSLALTVVFLPYMSTHIYLLSPLYFSLNIYFFFIVILRKRVFPSLFTLHVSVTGRMGPSGMQEQRTPFGNLRQEIGLQAFWWSSAAFQGTLAKSWVRPEKTRT